ncbi:MAG: hypothetical protein JWQ89_3919 [Devosia sp.]|uniref:DUF2934 domain-containing protein n=1 Tax=Devosia sp. TaxID=1871048 RepID=UPI002637FE74|nr:DUF2934 domain-containing protein [Devosia sp.]MDB5542192.1 hypothetical protein [Devosia sp.]
MTIPSDPAQRQPKGDHNRRLSLGIDPEQFAAAAGISVEELRDYENTWPDHAFSPMIAQRVGEALERLEEVLPNSEAAGIRRIQEGGDTLAADGVSLPPDPSIEQSIRDTAYYLWENDGRPEGRDDEYWHRAREAWLGQQTLDSAFEDAVEETDPEIETRDRPAGAGQQ